MTDEPQPTDDVSTDDSPIDDPSEDEPADSRRTFLKATGLLAAVGLGGLASTGTAAANPNNHDHLGQIWNGDPGQKWGFGVEVGPNTRYGIQAEAPERGLFGFANRSWGVTEGVFGRADATSGIGVRGVATGTATKGKGIEGIAQADSGETVGVHGLNKGFSGFGVLGEGNTGVRGITESFDGVKGVATSSSGFGYGVFGESACDDGRGVFGRAYSPTGDTTGVFGLSTSDSGRGVYGQASANSGNTIGVEGYSDSTAGTGVRGEGGDTGVIGKGPGGGVHGISDDDYGDGVRGTANATSGPAWGVAGTTNSPDGHGVYAENFGGVALYAAGDFVATGAKNFVETVETGSGPKEVVYTATEAGRALTEATDVAQLTNGRAVIDLPAHFGMVTSTKESLSVETTPYSIDSAGLAVTERSVDQIVVEDVDGSGNYEFSYTVKGTRKGYADKEVVREPKTPAAVTSASASANGQDGKKSSAPEPLPRPEGRKNENGDQ